ncbi:MAG: fructose-6-phosphate aldolase [Negativicutes bacterium]|nr:fructose-6-phosphate aldolase [Negativicutes bacterium]
MKLFLDSANLTEVADAAALGVIDGVTTNPSLIAKEKQDIKKVIREIAAIVPGPISAEVISTVYGEMLPEARELAKIAANVVIKVPITADGLKTAKSLSLEGIKTNVTLVFSVNQALLAARAGAAFVSPFVGRLDDIGQDGIELIKEITDVFAIQGIETEVIAASIRQPLHVTQAALAGSHIATIPYKVLLGMLNHPLTDAGIKRFLEDWQKANQ